MAKDRTPTDGRANGGGAGRAGAARGAKGGRTRPPANVVAPQRPWGLIAAAVAVVVFAVAVIGYAVMQVNAADANRVESIEEIDGITTAEYEAGQHVGTTVAYAESPPVGGEHDPVWADCTGTVYDVDIRHENAVHSLEHGAVWITYNPDELSQNDIDELAALVDNEPGRMLSPYAGLDSAISVQSWNHQLKVDSASDKRIKQFADLMTFNADVENHYPEIGASCENPQFKANPVVVGQDSTAVGSSDMATTPTATSAP